MTTREYLGSGWDRDAWLVDGTWVERTAKRSDVEPWLCTETTLLAWLAPQLPLEVPRPVVGTEEPFSVRHRLVPGGPCPDDGSGLGTAVGEFLAALHAVDLREAIGRGLPAPERTSAMRDARVDRRSREGSGLAAPRGRAGGRPGGDRGLRRTSEIAARARARRDVGPCYAVTHGDDVGDRGLVAEALTWFPAT